MRNRLFQCVVTIGFVCTRLVLSDAYMSNILPAGCDNTWSTGVVDITGCDTGVTNLNASALCGRYAFIGYGVTVTVCNDVPILKHTTSGMVMWYTKQTPTEGSKFIQLVCSREDH